MKTIQRKTDKKAIDLHWKIKTFSYNEQGQFFIIYNGYHRPEDNADLVVEEKLVCLNDNEARRLFKFVKEINK